MSTQPRWEQVPMNLVWSAKLDPCCTICQKSYKIPAFCQDGGLCPDHYNVAVDAGLKDDFQYIEDYEYHLSDDSDDYENNGGGRP